MAPLTYFLVAACAGVGLGAPGTPSDPSGTYTFASGNPFAGIQQWANNFYASEVMKQAVPNMTATLAAKASAVAKVPSFQWLDTRAKLSLMTDTLTDIRAANKAGGTPNAGLFVVYDLPDRDCAAASSNGELSVANNGVTTYKTEYIDAIRKVLTTFSDVPVILVIEPDSLANLVTNTGVAKCSGAQSAYLECVDYALKQLDLPNVVMYIDAGHAGWLAWPSNLQPAAKLFASVYKNAGSPKSLRGLATNVANYNGWNVSSPPSYTQGNSNYDESHYVAALAPELTSAGWPSAHFITDQGRSGKQPTGQQKWGDWCNAKGTGFGTRPTADTGNELLDAIVWVKPGGESDGTSDTSATRYDSHCGLDSAVKPAPEAGTWFQAYFEQLLENANPPF